MKRCIVCHRLIWPRQDRAFCTARFGGKVREIQWHRLVHHPSLPDEWVAWMKKSDDGICIEMSA